MAYKSDSAFLDSARSLLIAACTSFVMVSPVRAAEPTAAAPQLADGTWLVQARVDSDRRYCSDRLVRLTNRQGELSGAVALARASAPIHNLALLPNGSFSGATRGGVAGVKLGRFYKVTGKFSGDAVSVPWKVPVVLLVTAQPLDA